MTFSDLTAQEWLDAGRHLETETGSVFVVDVPARSATDAPPLLIIHGFPSCSYDYRGVLDALSAGRRVVLFDQLGFGWSDKPDRRYGIHLHADTAEAVLADLGITTIDLLTHDMGDSVGGELLARTADGSSAIDVRRRVVTDGSIYLDLAQLTPGQLALLDLPDERLELLSAENLVSGLAATFSSGHPASDDEIAAQVVMAAHQDGPSLLPRTIRYLEDRRAEEDRYTGAIETHPAPLGIIWGQLDPISVPAMAERLLERRPDASIVRIDDVAHYPMVEAPERFAAAAIEFLDNGSLA